MKKLLLLLCSSFLVFSCSDVVPTIAPEADTNTDTGTDEDIDEDELIPDDLVYNAFVDITNTHQTVESFASSDCWTMNYVGKYWAEQEKEDIAKLLFSKNIVDGQPEGIGLSGWRFNLGGGTYQQGDASGIGDISRRAESFIDPNTGIYYWTNQAGQQYFLDKAREYGVEQYTMFSNTPPVNFTKNGKGFSDGGQNTNLRDDAFDDFANYIADVLNYFKSSKGLEFDYISPVNEPQYDWSGGQEGSPWQNWEIAWLTREIDKALTEKSLNTKIMLAESGGWNYAYEGESSMHNVMHVLMAPGSEHYVGNLPHVAPLVAAHSYWTDWNWDSMIDTRKKLDENAKSLGLKAYQTEWSMLGDGYDLNEFVGYDNANYMDIALYMAKVIHTDMVYANCASWSYWTSVDMERWDHLNRFLLINITPADGVYGDIRNSGTHASTKTLWVLGNYSLFVKPGYKRVDVEVPNYSREFFATAFVSPAKDEVVTVYSNLSEEPEVITPEVKGQKVRATKVYLTSNSHDLTQLSLEQSYTITIPPKSVVTVVQQLKK